MAKTTRNTFIVLFIFCLFILFSFLHGGSTSILPKQSYSKSNSINGNFVQSLSSTPRKLLLGTNSFDFSPFMHRRRNHHPPQPENNIDPRYEVEKRLVPSGPNPLHH
nr:CLAVATA3/ESR (CLE)-related protein 12-like [Ipomoea batatas]